MSRAPCRPLGGPEEGQGGRRGRGPGAEADGDVGGRGQKQPVDAVRLGLQPHVALQRGRQPSFAAEASDASRASPRGGPAAPEAAPLALVALEVVEELHAPDLRDDEVAQLEVRRVERVGRRRHRGVRDHEAVDEVAVGRGDDAPAGRDVERRDRQRPRDGGVLGLPVLGGPPPVRRGAVRAVDVRRQQGDEGRRQVRAGDASVAPASSSTAAPAAGAEGDLVRPEGRVGQHAGDDEVAERAVGRRERVGCRRERDGRREEVVDEVAVRLEVRRALDEEVAPDERPPEHVERPGGRHRDEPSGTEAQALDHGSHRSRPPRVRV